MRRLFITLSTVLILAGCNDSSLFTEDLTKTEKACRTEAAELAFQIIATVDTDLTSEEFVLDTSINAYKDKGCSVKFVKNALNGMTTS